MTIYERLQSETPLVVKNLKLRHRSVVPDQTNGDTPHLRTQTSSV